MLSNNDFNTKNLSDQFKKHIELTKKKKGVYLLSTISLTLSTALFLWGFQQILMNILYLVNLSFFSLIFRDAWSVKNKNIIPIIAITISILLTSSTLIDILKALDAFTSLGSTLQDMFD